jgi:hypothetical protein
MICRLFCGECEFSKYSNLRALQERAFTQLLQTKQEFSKAKTKANPFKNAPMTDGIR